MFAAVRIGGSIRNNAPGAFLTLSLSNAAVGANTIATKRIKTLAIVAVRSMLIHTNAGNNNHRRMMDANFPTTVAATGCSSSLSFNSTNITSRKQQYQSQSKNNKMMMMMQHRHISSSSTIHNNNNDNEDVTLKTTTPETETVPSIKLYQYAICPYCNMIKALLDYASIEYESIEVNPLTKSEIKWSKDYKKVPIAVFNDNEVVLGSEKIIQSILTHPRIMSSLEKEGSSSRRFLLNSNDENENENSSTNNNKKWFDFSSNTLASLLYPNICATYSDSLHAFAYVHNITTFSMLQKYSIQYVGAAAMSFAASKIKKRKKIDDEKQALDDAIQELVESKDGFDNGGKLFLSIDAEMNKNNDSDGEATLQEPGLADIVVFGTLRSIQGLPTHQRILTEESSSSDKFTIIRQWYQRMEEKVVSNRG